MNKTFLIFAMIVDLLFMSIFALGIIQSLLLNQIDVIVKVFENPLLLFILFLTMLNLASLFREMNKSERRKK